MVDFYTIKSRDSSKIHILLAELGMKCQVFNLDFTMEDAKKADYLELSPYEGVPAILDLEGENGRQIHVFESGAILTYLAEKTHHFLGENEQEKAQVMSWLMFQISAVGPSFSNYEYAKDNNIPLMLNHFELESKRLLEAMNAQLAKTPYLAGSFYSIADMAMYPWIASTVKSKKEWYADTPYIRHWTELIGQRPAVRKLHDEKLF